MMAAMITAYQLGEVAKQRPVEAKPLKHSIMLPA